MEEIRGASSEEEEIPPPSSPSCDNDESPGGGLRYVTLDLIRKRGEERHGEMLLMSEYTDLDFHQDHLETLGPVLGRTCPRLQRLYLHNNLVSQLHGAEWRRFEDLRYLCLALNNLTHIPASLFRTETISAAATATTTASCCPQLQHLDVSFNFISVEAMESSLQSLQSLTQLQDLYLLGNPCERYSKTMAATATTGTTSKTLYEQICAALLPQLRRLDGHEMAVLSDQDKHHSATASDGRAILQQWRNCVALATTQQQQESSPSSNVEHKASNLELCRQMRLASSRETLQTQQRIDQQRQQSLSQRRAQYYGNSHENHPNHPKSHAQIVSETRRLEEQEQEQEETTGVAVGVDGNLNQGDWDYGVEYSSDVVVFTIPLRSKHDEGTVPSLDEMDLDVRPDRIRLIVRGQILRLRLHHRVRVPEAVVAGDDGDTHRHYQIAKAELSRATGKLRITLPLEQEHVVVMGNFKDGANDGVVAAMNGSNVVRPRSLATQMMEDAVRFPITTGNNDDNDTTNNDSSDDGDDDPPPIS